MNIVNKPLVVTFCLALLSLTAYQSVLLTNQKRSSVLGENTYSSSQMPMPPLEGGIPCSVINNLQRQYCSNTVPTAVPSPRPIATKTVTPSSSPCKVGLKTYTPYTSCDIGFFRFVSFICTDGLSYTLGNSTTCKSVDALKADAFNHCQKNGKCTPTPSMTRPSPNPTRRNTPTPTPSHKPYSLDGDPQVAPLAY